MISRSTTDTWHQINEIICPSMGDGTHREISNGHIAFFNGPPSSGKTSLVNSLRESLADPWFHLSLDDFRAGYSEQTWANDHADLFDRVLAGYLASLREMALLGHDILAEAVITPSRQSLYESSLGEMPIVLVGVRCDWEVAVQRESDRTDRRHGPIDLPLEDYVAVHAGLIYDFEVDTSSESPEDLATKLVLLFGSLTSSSFASHTSWLDGEVQ
jgi:chloramphenicol 3-O phosphotransferase